MAFTIEAELPLGTYRGHAADGRPEPVPSVSRLYSALLAAAGFGPRAQPSEGGDGLSPRPEDVRALRWLEDHPPQAVHIPPVVVNVATGTAYRRDGTINSHKGAYRERSPIGKPAAGSVAVGGPLRWVWTEDPPAAVADALTQLCGDVSHLGTSEAPARLNARAADAEVTHRLDAEADLFDGTGEDLEVPVAGRLDELTAAYNAGMARPSLAKDRVSGSEASQSAVPTRDSTVLARYRPTRRSRPTPWSSVLFVPFDKSVDPLYRVAWAVAAHRALVAHVGDGAPPVVTGAYPVGMRRPPNRVALHWLPEDAPIAWAPAPSARSVLAVLMPFDISPADAEVVAAAVARLTTVRGPGGRLLRRVGEPGSLPGDAVWQPPTSGSVRLWRTVPAAVPDTRGSGQAAWTFAQAALLSLGFVWQGVLGGVSGRGDQRDRALVDLVTGNGAAALTTAPVRRDVHRYVHKVNPHAVVRPYRAVVWLGDLAGQGAVTAIGQSRHLGGGLLVPLDVAEGADLADRLRRWRERP